MPVVPVSFVYGSRDWMDPRHAHALVSKLAVPASVRAARMFISSSRCACMSCRRVTLLQVHVVSNSGHHMCVLPQLVASMLR